jgi:hypothetical protein
VFVLFLNMQAHPFKFHGAITRVIKSRSIPLTHSSKVSVVLAYLSVGVGRGRRMKARSEHSSEDCIPGISFIQNHLRSFTQVSIFNRMLNIMGCGVN